MAMAIWASLWALMIERSVWRIFVISSRAFSTSPSAMSLLYLPSISKTLSSSLVRSSFVLATCVLFWYWATWRSAASRRSRSLANSASCRDSGMRVSFLGFSSALSSTFSSALSLSTSVAALSTSASTLSTSGLFSGRSSRVSDFSSDSNTSPRATASASGVLIVGLLAVAVSARLVLPLVPAPRAASRASVPCPGPSAEGHRTSFRVRAPAPCRPESSRARTRVP